MVKRHENLRQVQQALLRDMLSIKDDAPWKLLVMDTFVQRLISPSMRVVDLRDLGVTLHLQLHAKREPVPDVPAVYFCEPTASNIARIIDDCNTGLYTTLHLNFTTALPRTLLEQLARETGSAGSSARIARVYDQYMCFECLEPQLYTTPAGAGDGLLKMLLGTETEEQAVEERLDREAVALLSVAMSTGGQVPLMVCTSRGGAAESVASKLDVKIRNMLASTKSSNLGPSLLGSTDEVGLQRPLMLLIDRTVDLATPLRHTSSYAGLIADVFGMEHNRCTYSSPVSNDGKSTRGSAVFDVDPSDDALWLSISSKPFPQATQAIDEALRKYSEENDQLTSASAGNRNLMMTVSLLPEMQERKRLLDGHLSICSALLEAIKERQLGEYFALEQRLDRAAVVSWLANKTSPGSDIDKVRLYLLFMMLKERNIGLLERDCAAFLNTLDQSLRTKIDGFKRFVEFNSESGKRRALAGASTTASPAASPTAVSPSSPPFPPASGPHDEWMNKLLFGGGLLSGLAAGVKSLVGDSHELFMVRHVESVFERVCSPSPAGAPIDLAIFDPRQPRSEALSQQQHQHHGPGKSAFSHLIIHVVGGVSRLEYDALLAALPARHPQLLLSVGGTDLVTSSAVLSSFN